MQDLDDACAIRLNLCDGKRLRRFGVLYSASFWNGSQTVSKPTNPFSFGCFLTRRQKARVAVRNFGDRLLLAHMSPFALKPGLLIQTGRMSRRVDIRLRADRSARSCFFVGCVAHSQVSRA